MARSTRSKRRVRSVFEDLCDDGQEAKNLTLRTELMTIIDRVIEANGWTQQKAAEFFGTTQPRISDLQRGRIEKFSIDLLVEMVEMVERTGWTVDIKERVLISQVSYRRQRPSLSLNTDRFTRV